jgi:hypothetical protein
VAADERLLSLASHARAGQQPTFLLMGAVHYLAGDEMAGFDRASFTGFCLERQDELRHLLETRLVQTNAVPRSLVLRIGMTHVAAETAAPVHLIEVGASAGVHLRFDRYGYVVGGVQYGDTGSRVQIEAELRGTRALPDLDAIPPIASAVGVDLAPVDATDPDQRRWLEALVWPDNAREAELLAAAVEVLAADPPRVVAGDAVDVCPVLAEELPPGEPRVVFTIATRMHIPRERIAAFDAAILDLGANAPLYWIHAERSAEVVVRLPTESEVTVAAFGPRILWLEPL